MKSYLHIPRIGIIKNDILAGLVVAFALIPEVIAFSIAAGVDPKVGLYASFCISVVIAFAGGRPGMISAAAGSMALVMVLLVKNHGVAYLLVTTVLTGILQILAGWCKLASLMRFVSRSVFTGFVNALAILIFMAQLPELTHVTWHVYALTALGVGIIYFFPRLTKVIPSPLIAIVVITVIAVTGGLPVHRIGDMGALPDSLPYFLWPTVPLNWETLTIIFPTAATLAVVGLLESLMTATIVDDVTNTASNKNRECVGQGMANVVTGFFGGMAGCAMIGQTVINLKSGGRGRLSTLFAGVFLLVLSVFLGQWVAQIPMAALVAVMITVSVSTFDWSSIRRLRSSPLTSNVVMLVTVIVVVMTQDLAQGVLAGVILSGIFFAYKVDNVLVVFSQKDSTQDKRTYIVKGQLFFASAERFIQAFMLKEHIKEVCIDMQQARLWDITAVDAVDRVVKKLRDNQVNVCVLGLDKESAEMVRRFAHYDKTPE